MRSLAAALASVALLGFVLPATAQSRPSLPIGEWGDDFQGKADCKRPFLKIEPNLITIRLTDGEGKCKILSLKKKRNIIYGRFDCKWDKQIIPEELVSGDSEENEFSINVKSPTKLLYNNALHHLCSSDNEQSR